MLKQTHVLPHKSRMRHTLQSTSTLLFDNHRQFKKPFVTGGLTDCPSAQWPKPLPNLAAP